MNEPDRLQGGPEAGGSDRASSRADEIAVRLIHADVRSRVERRCPAGHALVLRCHPVRGAAGKLQPFPTLFWLVCPALIEAISQREHQGHIKRIESLLASDPSLASEVAQDHRAYIQERDELLSAAEREELDERGMLAALRQRGVGGIRNWAAIKCLHLHYAHHLARGSTVGRLLEHVGLPPPCPERAIEPDLG